MKEIIRRMEASGLYHEVVGLCDDVGQVAAVIFGAGATLVGSPELSGLAMQLSGELTNFRNSVDRTRLPVQG